MKEWDNRISSFPREQSKKKELPMTHPPHSDDSSRCFPEIGTRMFLTASRTDASRKSSKSDFLSPYPEEIVQHCHDYV